MGKDINTEFTNIQCAGIIPFYRIWVICKLEIFYVTQQLE